VDGADEGGTLRGRVVDHCDLLHEIHRDLLDGPLESLRRMEGGHDDEDAWVVEHSELRDPS
jgi:hypothetical protein